MLPTRVISLDGTWQLATDPQNVGREQKWFLAPRAEAKETKVPWIIQDAFPDYHGVAWYWREFTPPLGGHAGGRTLLRFWAVDYTAEAWLNGVRVGQHEDGEEPFTLDVTDTVRPGRPNLLAVRVLNPTNEPIDGITLNHTPHGIKVMPYQAGRNWNKGGICDSVELILAPRVRVEDVFVRGDWKSGRVRIQADVRNDANNDVSAGLELAVAPARSGTTVAAVRLGRTLRPGLTRIETTVDVPGHRLWELNDPQLYRLSLRVAENGSPSCDERTVRFGFRDFRFDRGYFRLNGRRIYLRCSHTTNCCPVGLEMPHDVDLLRRDLLNVKVMGFNAIRFIDGVAKRYQLDLCDEIGLMVYEESYAAWLMEDSPQMAQRYDRSVSSMVRRDRNHACLTIWGLLNETHEGAVFRHAVGFLPRLREMDDSRLVLLNSGRWDAAGGGRLMREQIPSVAFWAWMHQSEPWVGYKATADTVQALGITWPGRTLALHPGPAGEYSVVRWTAPAGGKVDVKAVFASIAERATTDAHVLHNGKGVYSGGVNVGGGGMQARYDGAIDVRTGDTLDFAVGWGNGSYGADSTSLALTIREGGKTHDAGSEFDPARNGSGGWSYGQLDGGPRPDSRTFRLYTRDKPQAVGSLSNPGSTQWQDVLDDRHPYQRVPHTAGIIQFLRTTGGQGKPLFLSEYGIGSAVDLVRVVKLYEQIGKGQAMDARFYRDRRDEFLADWKRWRMDEAFERPEEFFRQSLSRMAAQRLLGINAIRSNAGVVGHSVTGTVDQVMCGEGLTTTFRELKPGTVDALADAFAPLRWCLFVESPNVYRGGKVRVEAVLADEDALAPGKYPAVFRMAGPGPRTVWERRLTVEVPPRSAQAEPPLARPVLAEDVTIDGPPGRYRFLANFERGAAAAGGEAEFHVYQPPAEVQGEVTLWGQDDELAAWLSRHGLKTRAFDAGDAGSRGKREVIVASGKAPAGGGVEVMARLTERVREGATAIFLSPAVFSDGKNPTALLPLERKGRLVNLPSWLYHKDEWAKNHAIFAGLPAGGLMDYLVYRDVIPDTVFADLEAPAEAVAGANNAAVGYSSGLLVAVYELGKGRVVVNTLRIREGLGANPVADRLLLNMIRYAQELVTAGPQTRPAQ